MSITFLESDEEQLLWSEWFPKVLMLEMFTYDATGDPDKIKITSWINKCCDWMNVMLIL